MEDIASGFAKNQKELIHILHKIQEKCGYIPADAITRIANQLKISESEIFGVLTFYKAFALQPKGENQVTVCLGTACHVRGAVQIVEQMERKLKIKVGQTSPDGKFSLETVNCLGCCAIGPVVVVNGKYHSHVTVKKVDSVLKEYSNQGKQ